MLEGLCFPPGLGRPQAPPGGGWGGGHLSYLSEPADTMTYHWIKARNWMDFNENFEKCWLDLGMLMINRLITVKNLTDLKCINR